MASSRYCSSSGVEKTAVTRWAASSGVRPPTGTPPQVEPAGNADVAAAPCSGTIANPKTPRAKNITAKMGNTRRRGEGRNGFSIRRRIVPILPEEGCLSLPHSCLILSATIHHSEGKMSYDYQETTNDLLKRIDIHSKYGGS